MTLVIMGHFKVSDPEEMLKEKAERNIEGGRESLPAFRLLGLAAEAADGGGHYCSRE